MAATVSGPPFPKLKIPPKPELQQQPKKKKKNPADKPQPTWLFPPDDENPVLNPKSKTPEEIAQEKADRLKALDYMKRRVHAAPDRPAPPAQLLTLIGIFLTDFGFNSTSRLFTNERKARQELNGWEDAIGTKIEKGIPKLEKIYRDWHRDWTLLQRDETSSSGSDSHDDEQSKSDTNDEIGIRRGNQQISDASSEESSDVSDSSDAALKEPESKKKTGKLRKKTSASSSSSSSSTSSDSDADDERDQVVKAAPSAIGKNDTTRAQQTVGDMIKSLKRKAPEKSPEDSSSNSEPSSDDKRPAPGKKAKINAAGPNKVYEAIGKASNLFDIDFSSEDFSSSNRAAKQGTRKHQDTSITNAVGDSNSSGESGSSDASKSNASEGELSVRAAIISSVPVAASDSSVTVNGDVAKPAKLSTNQNESSSSTSSSPSDSSSAQSTLSKKEAMRKKQHQGAKPTPLAEMSGKANEGSYLSNKYIPYAYADRAYQDLSVTRGKGFTKEKNKKKRGSYRGGAIDTAGGKSFKFED